MDVGVPLVTSSDWFGIDYTVLPSAQCLSPCLATKGMSVLSFSSLQCQDVLDAAHLTTVVYLVVELPLGFPT